MGSASGLSMNDTWLGRLMQVPPDPAAWSEFGKRYGPKIRSWCHRWNVQEADVDDVTQQVLLNLLQSIGTYQRPKGGFRKWLKRVTRNALGKYLKHQVRAGKGSGDTIVLHQLHSLEARKDFVKCLEEEFDLELLEVALGRVRQAVHPNTWEAFWLTEREKRTIAEAAAQLQMTVAAVYVARNRVKKMLEAALRELEGPDEE
jgi:RNA polymerase sigma factor (sigma-70 family)